MISKTVRVTQWMNVQVDETKFTPEFLAEYASYMNDLTFNEHIESLAYMGAFGEDINYTQCLEGYGDPKEFGIKVTQLDVETEIED